MKIGSQLTNSFCAPGVVLSLSILAGNGTFRDRARITNLFAGLGSGESRTADVLPSSQSFPCLPKDIRPDEVVSFRLKGTSELTLEKKLIEMKARCRKGKLVDAKGRGVRFFRPSCWGNPPPDYLEIRQREDEELAKLRKRYAVIVFACNPMIQ